MEWPCVAVIHHQWASYCCNVGGCSLYIFVQMNFQYQSNRALDWAYLMWPDYCHWNCGLCSGVSWLLGEIMWSGKLTFVNAGTKEWSHSINNPLPCYLYPATTRSCCAETAFMAFKASLCHSLWTCYWHCSQSSCWHYGWSVFMPLMVDFHSSALLPMLLVFVLFLDGHLGSLGIELIFLAWFCFNRYWLHHSSAVLGLRHHYGRVIPWLDVSTGSNPCLPCMLPSMQMGFQLHCAGLCQDHQ